MKARARKLLKELKKLSVNPLSSPGRSRAQGPSPVVSQPRSFIDIGARPRVSFSGCSVPRDVRSISRLTVSLCPGQSPCTKP